MPMVKTRYEDEVIELHQFFQDWFNGTLALTIENFARFTEVLSEDFIIVGPNGKVTERAPLVNDLMDAHNSRLKLKIWIENFQLRHREGHITVATYEEWQQLADGETTTRLSTVVFREEAGTPNGVVWVHVHETWLEG